MSKSKYEMLSQEQKHCDLRGLTGAATKDNALGRFCYDHTSSVVNES